MRWAGNSIGAEGAAALAEALKVYSGSLGTLNLRGECSRFAFSALHHQTDNGCDNSTCMCTTTNVRISSGAGMDMKHTQGRLITCLVCESMLRAVWWCDGGGAYARGGWLIVTLASSTWLVECDDDNHASRRCPTERDLMMVV